MACPNCGRALADPATASYPSKPESEEPVDLELLREHSRRPVLGLGIELLALLVAAAVTLTLASLREPVPSVPWSKYLAAEQSKRSTDSERGIGAPSRDTTAAAESAVQGAGGLATRDPARATPRVAPQTRGIDLVVLALVAIAAARGVVIGALRAATSITVLAATLIALNVWHEPVAHWLRNPNGVAMRYDVAPWLAGVLLGIAVLAAGATFARVMRQDARARARGTSDRLVGATLGATEGLIIGGLVVFVAGAWLGRSHAMLTTSRSLALLERTEQFASRPSDLPDVAAPPESR